jgi:hypothetical protein
METAFETIFSWISKFIRGTILSHIAFNGVTTLEMIRIWTFERSNVSE